MQDTWSHVEFKFTQHKGTDVYLVKMAEEDFEALEDNQVLVQVRLLHKQDTNETRYTCLRYASNHMLHMIASSAKTSIASRNQTCLPVLLLCQLYLPQG